MGKGGNWLHPLVVAVVLFLFWLAYPQICSPKLDSPTYDESLFIAEGVYIWRQADYSFAMQHPPMTAILIGIPLQSMALDVPTRREILDENIESDGKDPIMSNYVRDYPPDQLVRNPHYIGYHLIYGYNRWDADEIFTRCRRVVQLMHYILVFFVYLIARKLFNNLAAIIAATIALFDPNLVAHGHLCTTDLPAALFAVAAFYFLIVATESGKLRWEIIALWGISLGLMCATKYSCLLFLVIYIGIFLWAFRHNMRWAIVSAATAIGVGFVVCLIIGGFSLEPYTETLKQLMSGMERGRPSYLLGHYSMSGFPLYYLATLLFKMPLGLLLLAIAGIFAGAFRWRARGHTIGETALWLTAIVFLVSTIAFHGISLGIRHILVIYPFLIFIGVSIVPSARKYSAATFAALLLTAVFLIESIPAMRDSIPFFNWPSRRAAYEGKLLADSNIDWGQDLGRLEEFCVRNNIRLLHLRYFGTADPHYHLSEIPGSSLDIMGPEYNNEPGPAGWYAVSFQRSLGVIGRSRAPGDWSEPLGWLSETEPYARVGGSILIYHYQP